MLKRLGCPVVCSDRSATPEVAGEGALTFDPTDAGALAACLRRLIEEPALRESLVAKGRSNQARYTWDATARGYADLLDAVLAGADPPPRPL
jgi:glycosyltransferase involved in cell wall biosynthesis